MNYSLYHCHSEENYFNLVDDNCSFHCRRLKEHSSPWPQMVHLVLILTSNFMPCLGLGLQLCALYQASCYGPSVQIGLLIYCRHYSSHLYVCTYDICEFAADTECSHFVILLLP